MGGLNQFTHGFTAEEDKFILANYKTMTYEEIGKIIGRSASCVRARVRRYLKAVPKTKKQKWTDDELKILLNEYQRNPGVYELLPNHTPQAIRYKAWELGLSRVKNRGHYELDVDYFKTWTPNMAYMLGLIAADGNVLYEPKVLTIVLKESDKYLLEEFAKEIKCRRPLQKHSSGCWSFVVRNGELVDDLAKLGILPRKSLTMQWLPVPDEMLAHFVRGYVDGDGTICYYYRNRGGRNDLILEVSILGAPAFLNGMADAISRVIGIPKVKVLSTHSKIKKIRYSCGTAVKLLSWLYQDAELYLARKFNIYKTYLELDGSLGAA